MSVSKKGSIWKLAPEKYCVKVPKMFSIWKMASNMYWMPFPKKMLIWKHDTENIWAQLSTSWRDKQRIRQYSPPWIGNRAQMELYRRGNEKAGVGGGFDSESVGKTETSTSKERSTSNRNWLFEHIYNIANRKWNQFKRNG